MILTKSVIEELINNGEISIDPLMPEHIGPGSIDLTLSSELRLFKKDHLIIGALDDFRDVTDFFEMTDNYIIQPGELILGITVETIQLPADICGWLNSRSRCARIGLMSHITAPFIAPGVNNRQVLEIYNAGPLQIRLEPGMPICQLVLQRSEGMATYDGTWTAQTLR